MVQLHRLLVLAGTLTCLPTSLAIGQLAGSRAGIEGGPSPHMVADLPRLDREIAEGYIAIDGRVESRVPPTEIRIVLAVTSEAETAQQCRHAIAERVNGLKSKWAKMDISADRIVEDFIAVLPRYEWSIEQRGGVDVGIEKRVGYRMQTNLHLAVNGPGQAQEALNRAFELGITDIIGFDYWNKDLDKLKSTVREQALRAARAKAETLFTVFADKKPGPINVQEQTTVHYPESMYQSFTNSQSQQFTQSYRRDIPSVSAHRPANTYYRGLNSGSDVQPPTLPMQPEISIVSTVRIYYESPAAERSQQKRKRDKKAEPQK